MAWFEPIDCCKSENSHTRFVLFWRLTDEFLGLGADLNDAASRHRLHDQTIHARILYQLTGMKD